MYAENKKNPIGQKHFRSCLNFSLQTQLSHGLPEQPWRNNSSGQQDATVKQQPKLKYMSSFSLHAIQSQL